VPRAPEVLARELLGGAPDAIEPLITWTDRAAHRVTIGAESFVIKTDDELETVAREVAGQRRAAAAGVRVPEVVAACDDAFAMRWVDGTTLEHHSTARAWHDTGAQIRIAHDLGGGPPFGAGFGGFEPQRPTWRAFFEASAETALRECERDLDFPAEQAARIRAALSAATPTLDTAHIAWCHGDLQTEHVIVDPATDRVAAIIDWADQGSGDPAWDVTVLTIDDSSCMTAFLDGYDAGAELRSAIDDVMPLYTVVRRLGAAAWLAEHRHPLAADRLNRSIDWRP
jgi:aminoglycoside phosphotransferase (APT) family kinase protein